jgi:transposase InsO family protein
MGKRLSHNRIAQGNPWSAGCSETGTSGAEGGPGKRAGRNPGTAPRSDPYTKLPGPDRGSFFDLYVILDIYSRYAPGWLVAPGESAELAERLIADTIARVGVAPGVVHADRGSSMTSKPVAQLLVDLGIVRSHSRPYVCLLTG